MYQTKRKEKLTFHIFDNELFPNQKQFKFVDNSIFQPNKMTYVFKNPQCFMSGGLMVDDIIMISRRS